MSLRALVHPPSARMHECELTYLPRRPIDYERACEQHEIFCGTLQSLGVDVIFARGNESFADAAMVEDCAIVLDNFAVVMSMGVASRRGEPEAIGQTLRGQGLEVLRITPPAQIEGGDVLRIGRRLLVGRSSRTNDEGIDALKALVEPRGFTVQPISVVGCLHLKTACVAIDDETLLARSDWLNLADAAWDGLDVLEAPVQEPWGANVLRVGDTLCLPSSHPDTAKWLLSRKHRVRTMRLGEFEKAEAGITCLSILWEGDVQAPCPKA